MKKGVIRCTVHWLTPLPGYGATSCSHFFSTSYWNHGLELVVQRHNEAVALKGEREKEVDTRDADDVWTAESIQDEKQQMMGIEMCSVENILHHHHPSHATSGASCSYVAQLQR